MRTTIDEALAQFELIAGVGGEADHKACAMSLLAWLDECDEWTDHPKCAHSIIASQVIQANDALGTTAEMRADLVRLGTVGVLDTWWIPVEVIAWCMRGEKDKEPPGIYDRAVKLLERITAWKDDKVQPDLRGADLRGADLGGADLRGADLRGADLRGANLGGADLGDADLGGADLGDADLGGADLGDAYLGGADLGGADLRGAYGTPSDLPTGYSMVDGKITKS